LTNAAKPAPPCCIASRYDESPVEMDSPTTRPTLLARLGNASDRHAWREFDRRYGDLVIGYCRGCGLQLSDAEDVRQLVMASFARTFPRFEYSRQVGRFRDYFRTVVRRAIARHVSRHASRELALENSALDALSPGETSEADEQWEEQWVRHHCRRALAKLRESAEPRSIEIFNRLLAGETHEGVAKGLGITCEAVRKSKQRIKDRLREIIAAQILEENGHAE